MEGIKTVVIMKKKVIGLVLIVVLVSLFGCSAKNENVTLKIICESKGIYQLFYSVYLGEESMGHGGMADLENTEIESGREFEIQFSKERFEGAEDLSSFSIDVSPYGKDDKTEIATTEKLVIAAEYGKSYTVIFSGDRESGFSLELQP